MNSTVQMGDFTVTSTAPAEEVVASLTPRKPEEPSPKVLVRDGVPVKEEDEQKSELSKAASELGKKGAEAAAQKRAEEKKAKPIPPEKEAEKAAEAKEAKPAEEAEEAKEEKPEAKAEEKPEEKPLGKPRDDPRARMLEATRKEAEAKREAARERAAREDLERRLAEVERRTAPPAKEQPKQEAQPSDDPEPKVEDFEDYSQFLDARSRWAIRDEHRKLEGQRSEKERQERFELGARHALGTYSQHMKKAAEADPDFRERVAPVLAALAPPTPLAAQRGEWSPDSWTTDQIILSGEKAPALLLHFAEHPEEFQRILALRSMDDVAVEVRVIARTLDAATAGDSPRAEVSKAKPPFQPVKGSPPIAQEQGYRPGMSLDEYARVWKPSKA